MIACYKPINFLLSSLSPLLSPPPASCPCACRDRPGHGTRGTTDSTACQLNEFRCTKNGRCIDETKKCDHWDDCGDNSDEKDCDFPPCHEGQFRCSNAICIPLRWRCDGHADCTDHSDEVNCSKRLPLPINFISSLSRPRTSHQVLISLQCTAVPLLPGMLHGTRVKEFTRRCCGHTRRCAVRY